MRNTVGILLAGGLSSRFGSPKAFARVDGVYFYEKVYKALDAVCDQVIIVTREELMPLFPQELDLVTDLPDIKGQGPLAGICTAMTLRPAATYMVLPCDMPYIGPEETNAFRQLSAGTKHVTGVQTPEGKIPLFSLWKGNFAEEMERAISNGNLSVFDFLGSLETDWVDASIIHQDQSKFRNINRNTV